MRDDIVHGASAYANNTCRCEACTDAHRRRHKAFRAARRAARVLVAGQLIAPLPDECHGKPSTYSNHLCRCRECTRAWYERCLRDRKRREERRAA